MREISKVLYESNNGASTNRPRTINLSDSVLNYDVLRIYCGFDSDGYTINELNVKTFARTTGDSFVWTYYWGGGTAGTNGSMRLGVYKLPQDNKSQLVASTFIATYLNANPYTVQGNNDWLPVPIYKIIGVRYI